MDHEPSPEFQAWVPKLDKLSRELTEQQRPPAPNRLTPELIGATADDALDDLVLEFVDGRRPADGAEVDYGWLEALPAGVRMMWCSIAVEGELNNGGFNQFFFNGTDALAPWAIAGFEAVGAELFAVIIKEAILRAGEHASDVARSWGHGSLDDLMGSYKDAIFKDLDDRFYALYNRVDPASLRVAWMRAHASELNTA
jgi:uncharacterized protein DUF4375